MENEACGFSDFDRGAMRQKMTIFKEKNSVWRGTKNFEWRNYDGDVVENHYFIQRKLVAKNIILHEQN